MLRITLSILLLILCGQSISLASSIKSEELREKVSGKLYSPNGLSFVAWHCTGKYSSKCQITAKFESGEEKVISSDRLPPLEIIWLSNKMVNFVNGCSNWCESFTFFHSEKGLSKTFFSSKAVDESKLVVLAIKPYANSYSDKITIHVYDIYSEKVIQEIEMPDFSPMAVTVSGIKEASFNSDNTIYLKYMSGKNYVDKEINVPMNEAVKSMPDLAGK